MKLALPRPAQVFAAASVLGLVLAMVVFGLGVGTGMVLHRLNEINHGGCAALYDRSN